MTRHLQPVPTMNSLRRTRTRQKHTSSLGSYSAYAGERFSDEDEDDDDADEGDGDSGWSSTSLDTKDHTASLFSLVTSLDKSSTDTVTPVCTAVFHFLACHAYANLRFVLLQLGPTTIVSCLTYLHCFLILFTVPIVSSPPLELSILSVILNRIDLRQVRRSEG